jgi:signal transduction histidine kinase
MPGSGQETVKTACGSRQDRRLPLPVDSRLDENGARELATLTHKPSDGSALIVGLLLLSLALASVLAWQAVDAAASHRAAAEAVLRDYAQLAADEFVRRGASEIGYRGYYRLLDALGKAGGEAGALPTREALIGGDARIEPALSLAAYFFRLDPPSGRLETAAGLEPAPAVAAWLRALDPSGAVEPGGRERPMTAHHVEIEDVPHRFIYAARSEPPRVIGFEVARDGFGAWFERALARGSLLPPSLDKGAGDADDLTVTVRDARGREVFRAGPVARDSDPHPLSASAPFGDAYEGILEGMTVQVTLEPDAAVRLVIGGLPRSRLPVLLGLLALTTGLLLAAIVQLRRARALGRLRSDFVSRVSHELRTPLTQIRMFAETLLLGRVRSEDEGRRCLEIVDQEARRLGHLVENILQFSRGERGAVRLSPEPLPLVPLVRDLVRDFAPLAGRREVSFAVHPADDATVMVDPDAMRQILLNLLDNAVKYGPAAQQVVIGVERSGGRVRLSVDDQGPGIPARERRRVWRSFERLERDRRSSVAGTGIGLAVVRDLVALHGGSARVERGARGGARFVVELPLHDGTTAAAEPGEVPA